MADVPTPPGPTILTVGHSTLSLEAFLERLEAHDVAVLVDVRRFPGSRRHPHFAQAPLAEALAARGIEYLHEEELGGRRRVQPGSPNGAWRVRGFQAYADHADTDRFRSAVERVAARARDLAREGAGQLAVMCAEARPEQCHRRLLADQLVVRGFAVRHILDDRRTRLHALPPFARVEGTRVTYPPERAEGGASPEGEG